MPPDVSHIGKHLSEDELSNEFICINEIKRIKRYEEYELYCRLCEFHVKCQDDVSIHVKGKEHRILKKRLLDRQFFLKLWTEKPPPMYPEISNFMSEIKGLMSKVQEFYEVYPIFEIEKKLKSFQNVVKGYEIKFHLFGSYRVGLMTNDNPIIDTFVCIKKSGGSNDLNYSELKMSEKLSVFDQLPFTARSKHETVFFGFLCTLKIKNSTAKFFCTLDARASNAVSSSYLLSFYTFACPLFHQLAFVFRVWAKKMKFFVKSSDFRVSGSSFDYMVIYYLQKHYGLPLIEESRIGCPLPEFLKKDLKSQIYIVQTIFEPFFNSYSNISFASLFTNLILFYGCAFDYSHFIQITSSKPISKETNGLRTIKILDPIPENAFNIFSMSPENVTHLENLFFYGTWDILQPRNEKGLPIEIMVEFNSVSITSRLPILSLENYLDLNPKYNLLDCTFLNGIGIWNPDSVHRPDICCRFCYGREHTAKTCKHLRCFEPTREIIKGLDVVLTSVIKQNYEDERIDKEHAEEAQGFIEWLEKIVERKVSYIVKFEPFGSLVSGFGTKGSDFDLCIKNTNNEIFTTKDGIDVLKKIGKALKSTDRFQLTYVLAARVPVLKFTFADSVFPCEGDISFSNQLALLNTQLLKTYASFDKRVAPLVIAIKKWANLSDINSAAYGTFSSYALSVMVIHFLQNVKILPYLQNKQKFKLDIKIVDGFEVQFGKPSSEYIKEFCKNKMSLGQLFIQFFEYFDKFNLTDNVVQIRQNTDMTKLEKDWSRSSIAIEDPFELTHNLSGGIRDSNYFHIKKCFNVTRNEFRNSHSVFLKDGFTLKSDDLKKVMPQRNLFCFKCGNKGHYASKCLN